MPTKKTANTNLESNKKKKDTFTDHANLPVQPTKQTSLPPTTTAQEDIVTGLQSVVNLIWENTQSAIAKFVVYLVNVCIALIVIAVVIQMVRDFAVSVNQMALIGLCFTFFNFEIGLIVGFYFSRTNNTNTGGVGPKPTNDLGQEIPR